VWLLLQYLFWSEYLLSERCEERLVFIISNLNLSSNFEDLNRGGFGGIF
jgi:hypothetical protein